MEGFVISHRYALDAGGPKRLEVRHTAGWDEVSVSVDGHELGTTDGDTLLNGGLDFALHDNSLLHIWLERELGERLTFNATRDGKPIGGTAADPNSWIHPAAGVMLAIGVPQVALAIALMFTTRPSLLLLASGLALTLLGIAAWRRSAAAILAGGLIACVEIGWFVRTNGTFSGPSDWIRLIVGMIVGAALMIRAAIAANS